MIEFSEEGDEIDARIGRDPIVRTILAGDKPVEAHGDMVAE